MMEKNESFLECVPLFAGLPEEAQSAIAGRMRRRRLAADAPVVYRGEPAGALYVIVSGRVKVHLPTAYGEEVILEILGVGEFFGEMSLLDGRPRAADVTTTEPTELALLDGEALHEIVAAQPVVAWSMLRALSQRVREQNTQIEMLMTRDVAGRVAGLLLRLATTQGHPLASDGNSVRIEVTLSQSDIAAFVGATRERVSRSLTTFRKQGAICWDKPTGRWIVCNRPILAKRAEMEEKPLLD